MFNVTALFYADCLFFFNADSIWVIFHLNNEPDPDLPHAYYPGCNTKGLYKYIGALYTHTWPLELNTWTFEGFFSYGHLSISYTTKDPEEIETVLFCLILFHFWAFTFNFWFVRIYFKYIECEL